MFRVLLSRLPVSRPCGRQRFFVSTVLLNRTWENESVVELRKEAKVRGLSSKGNKASLISRIQEHDKNKSLDAIASHDPPVPVGAMAISTGANIEGVMPGIPLLPPSAYSSEDLMSISLPDVSQPDPESPIQIPYVPDFWDSSLPTAKHTIEEPLPKLLVVAGADTHPGGGPSHNLVDENAPIQTDHLHVDVQQPKGQGRIWDDIADDIGLPPPGVIKNAFWKLFS